MKKNDQRTIFEVKQDMINRLELTRYALMEELGVKFDVDGYKKRIEAVSIAHTKENGDELANINDEIIKFIDQAVATASIIH